MKKLIIALAFFLPVIFVACGDEDDEPEVEIKGQKLNHSYIHSTTGKLAKHLARR